MSTAINPKGPPVSAPGTDAATWAETYLASSVGSKVIVALTGLGLAGFVVFHMIGNLKLLSGPDAINAYAYFLKHELGALIWIARAGLLGLFVLHLAITIRLQANASSARPVGYMNQRPAQATLASQTMLLTGVVIGAFTLFHLAHYTFAVAHSADLGNGRHVNYLDLMQELPDGTKRHDVYSMMVAGFRTPWISVLYVLAQVVLAVHLSHGVQSALRTLGLVGKRFLPVAQGLGYAVAGTVLVGNVVIVAAVWTGYVAPIHPMVK